MKQPRANGAKESVVADSAVVATVRNRAQQDPCRSGSFQHFVQQLSTTAGNRASGRWLQAKLNMGSTDSPEELEADRVADRVTQAEGSNFVSTPNAAGQPVIRRQCSHCEEERESELRRKPIAGAGPASQASSESHTGRQFGAGEPLSPALRSYFEPRMGADFGSVRIHRDVGAGEAAQSINARAFTLGNNIAFASGQFAPESPDGRKLLAHELTHVLQSQPRAGADQTIRRLPASEEEPTPKVKGDLKRTSPSGGTPLGDGTLSWNERFIGTKGSLDVNAGGVQITVPTDVQMDVEFTPNADAAKKCPTISFLQTVKPTTGGSPDTPHLLFTRDAGSGASADTLLGETEPFYGVGPNAAAPGLRPDMPSSTAAGSAVGRSAQASFGDAPIRGTSLIPYGQKAVREFEVAPICVETGKTFGSIKWGYIKTPDAEIELTGGQLADVQKGSATAQLENVRRAFYSGNFQFSVPNFDRGSATLTPEHKRVLALVLASGSARKYVLVGANDFSGGPENDAGLSLRRAEAVRAFLIQQGIPEDMIEVQGHGVEARVPNRPAEQQPANRRVDIHIDRGISHLGPQNHPNNPVGSAREDLRFRHQDARETFEELLELLTSLQGVAKVPTAQCNQLIHIRDGLLRARALDRSVPNVEEIYGSSIRAVLGKCVPLIDRPPIDLGPAPLQPPSFIHKIEESVDDAGL